MRSDWGREMAHREWEAACDQVIRMRQMYPEPPQDYTLNWQNEILREVGEFPDTHRARAWLGSVARWLAKPLWNQDELFGLAREELNRLRAEVYRDRR